MELKTIFFSVCYDFVFFSMTCEAAFFKTLFGNYPLKVVMMYHNTILAPKLATYKFPNKL